MTLLNVSAISLAAALTVAAFAPAAHALDETVVEANTVRPVAQVNYADLDLANTADVQALQRRVRRAASALCMEHANKDLHRQRAGVACRNQAIESAAPQISAAVANAGTQMASSDAATITIAMP